MHQKNKRQDTENDKKLEGEEQHRTKQDIHSPGLHTKTAREKTTAGKRDEAKTGRWGDRFDPHQFQNSEKKRGQKLRKESRTGQVKKQLKFLYLNARSLINKFDEFVATIQALNADVVGVTENWANDNIFNYEISVEGYKLFRHDRPTGNKGGGVLLYVRSELDSTEYCPKSTYPEHKWCKIQNDNYEEIVVGVCYRTGNDDIFGPENHRDLRQQFR